MMTETPLRVLLGSWGTLGEIQPVLGVGAALQARGHEVRILAPAMYEKNARTLGLDFSAVGELEQFDQFLSQKLLWHPVVGYVLLARGITDIIEPAYQTILKYHAPGRTVLVNTWMFFGARIARDVLGIPTVTLHPHPTILRSRIDPPQIRPLPLRRGAPAWNDFWFGAVDLLMDQLLAKPVNAFCADFKLPKVKRLMRDWIHSPDRVIGLFPDWYGQPQEDWPKQMVLTGFPLYDASKQAPLPADLLRFLDEGPPPLVFTSGMRDAAAYFSTAIDICRTSGRRAVLLSPIDENFPAELPPNVRCYAYAPHSQLLPRSAVFFNHGGVGSVAQALAAGTPQIVVPNVFDQADNGARIERLGAGVAIPAHKFNVQTGIAAVERVLGEGFARACADVKARFANAQTMERTVDWIERAFAERKRSA